MGLALVIICFVVVIYFDRFPIHNIKNLTVKEIVLSEGDYIMNEDIAAGTYDIEVVEGDILYFSKKISKGDKVYGQECYNKNHFILEGSGKVKLVPSTFQALVKDDNIYKIENSGRYIVGKQIQAGEYKMSFISLDTSKLPFIQILDKDKNGLVSYSFDNENSYDIILKDTNILEIFKGMHEEYKDYYIVLQSK